MLSRPTIEAAVREYALICGYVRRRQEMEPAARLLQLPKFPNKVTESMVGLLIERGLLVPELMPGVVRVPGQTSDVEVIRSTGETVRIEVKGTAGAGFTLLYAKDCAADYVVWVDVSALTQGGDTVNIFTIRRLGRFYPANSKVTLPSFLTRTGRESTRTTVGLAAL